MRYSNPLTACKQVRSNAWRHLRVMRGAPRSILLGRRNTQIHQRLYRRECFRSFTTRTIPCFSHPSNTPTPIPTTTSFFRALQAHEPESLAVRHSKSGRSFTYGDLTRDISRSRELLQQKCGSLSGQRVAFLAENGYDYVVMLFSILASDAIALPLSPSFPAVELKYILDNSNAKMLLATERYASKALELIDPNAILGSDLVVDIRPKIKTSEKSDSVEYLTDIQDSKGGLMLYTSGTTNRPKGVLLPLSALLAQALSLIEAWRYSPQDYLLHLLPLHHIHGVVNAVIVPTLAGSAIEFMYPFNPDAVWHRLAGPFLPGSAKSQDNNNKINFLTAVPTLWTRLMSTFPSLPTNIQTAAKQAIAPENLRLNISGSAALPTPTKRAWTELSSGNVLLERYGMTEVGMAISCGLDPSDRVDGSVGWPLPSVEARLWDTDKSEVINSGEELDGTGRERVGEIQLRGPTIFKEYWGNPEATIESFLQDEDNNDSRGAWFRTGDVAVRRVVEGSGQGSSGEWAQGPMYFIQGRLSVDIIKTGGEKVSALEVERELLSLPEIAEAAVVGLPSERWGQKVAAIIVLRQDASKDGKPWGSMMDVRRALKGRLAMHKLPQELKVLAGPIPRNAMGKVNKKLLVKEVFADSM